MAHPLAAPGALSGTIERLFRVGGCDERCRVSLSHCDPLPTQLLEQSDVAVVRVRGTCLYHDARKSEDGNAEKKGGRCVCEETALREGLSLFVKVVDLAGLRARMHKTDDKWRISARSFENEAAFYAMAPVEELLRAGVHIPRVYSCEASHDPEHGKFGLRVVTLLEYLDPKAHVQAAVLSEQQTLSALAFLARFHAQFYIPRNDSDARRTDPPPLFAKLFHRGGWWRKALRPSVNFDKIPSAFDALCAAFPEALAGVNTAGHRDVVRRLCECVPRIRDAIDRAPTATLVHGDFKTSNIFFRCEGAASNEAAVIDFQWTGPASSGAGDVVYLLYGGVEFELLEREGDFVRAYVDAFAAALASRGLSESVIACARSEFERLYPLELLDYFTTALPQLMADLTPEGCEGNRGKYGWLTHEFDARVVALFVQRAVEAAAHIDDILAG